MATDRPRATLPLFFWDARGQALSKGAGHFKIGNFGDLASADIVAWLAGSPVHHAAADGSERRLLAIGSILHCARDGDVVWGTGLKGSAANRFAARDLDIRSVRGPITYDFLKRRGIALDKVSTLFDPGTLAPLLPAFAGRRVDTLPRRPLAIIPHFRDMGWFRLRHWRHRAAILSVDRTLIDMMAAIAAADRVISSSLHGIIVAEALGVPAVWLAPRSDESLLKYYDYYYSTERYDVTPCATLAAALRREPPPLPHFDHQAMIASFPHDRLADLRGGDA